MAEEHHHKKEEHHSSHEHKSHHEKHSSEHHEKKEHHETKKSPLSFLSKIKINKIQALTIILLLFIVFLGSFVRVLDYSFPYLRNIDSYTVFREIELIVELGYAPLRDPIGGLAPEIVAKENLPIRRELLPYQYLGAFSYIFVNEFIAEMQLWQYLIFYPAIIASLAAIPMYFLVKHLYDKRAGLIASFLYIFSTQVVARSLGGDPDTDAIVFLMPIILLALFVYTYKYLEKLNKLTPGGIAYIILTGIALLVWSFSWVGYWYIVWMLVGFVIARTAADAFLSKNIKTAIKENRFIIITLILAIVVFNLLNFPFRGFIFFNDMLGPFQFQQIKSEEGISFPNVYVSVAELQAPGGGISDVIRNAIGVQPIGFQELMWMIVVAAYFGIIGWLYSKKDMKTKEELFLPIILGLMLVGFLIVNTIVISAFILLVGAALYLFSTSIEKKEGVDNTNLFIIWLVGAALAGVVALLISGITGFQSELLFVAAIVLLMGGMMFKMYERVRIQKNLDAVILITIWFVGPALATLIATRFTTLMAAPLVVGAAIAISKLIKMSLNEKDEVDKVEA